MRVTRAIADDEQSGAAIASAFGSKGRADLAIFPGISIAPEQLSVFLAKSSGLIPVSVTDLISSRAIARVRNGDRLGGTGTCLDTVEIDGRGIE